MPQWLKIQTDMWPQFNPIQVSCFCFSKQNYFYFKTNFLKLRNDCGVFLDYNGGHYMVVLSVGDELPNQMFPPVSTPILTSTLLNLSLASASKKTVIIPKIVQSIVYSSVR